MWIEYKGDGIVGPAKIGWDVIKNKGKRLEYGNQVFRTLRGSGFKSNYYDTYTHEEHWISGCRKDGRDALYGTTVEVDDDALEEYWVNIRQQPNNKPIKYFSAMSKY